MLESYSCYISKYYVKNLLFDFVLLMKTAHAVSNNYTGAACKCCACTAVIIVTTGQLVNQLLFLLLNPKVDSHFAVQQRVEG